MIIFRPISVSAVDRENHSLIIHCSQKLQRDATYQIDIKFEGKLGTDSQSPFFQGSYQEKEGGEPRCISYSKVLYLTIFF